MTDKKQKILIVDDTPENIELLRQLLKQDYTVIAAINGEKALKLAHGSSKPDMILLDIMMPGMDGYEVCTRLKEDPDTCEIPVIFITALTQTGHEAKGLELGAVDYITKPFEPLLVKSRIHNQLELKRHQDNLEQLVKERTRELAITQQVTIEAMGTLAEYRDPETGGHIKRTQSYIRAVARYLSQHNEKYQQLLSDDIIEKLYNVAPLHDIGKVSVRDDILLKPGKLTKDEFELMKKHVEYGSQAIMSAEKRLGSSSYFALAREIIENHHEKWDGSGYPNQKQGEQIPLSGRLMAIADVYDALISVRVYKQAMSHEQALDIIKEGRDTHFAPDIVDAFMAIEQEVHEIALTYADQILK
ncbi:MAG: two-component system response regulator [Gammaproteobacteria bacterium]|nr:two-component system response regulator [Gammaproteobacteria bacterium]